MLTNLRKHGEHSGSWVCHLKLIALKKRDDQKKTLKQGRTAFHLDIKVSKLTQRLQGFQGCHLSHKKLKLNF